MRDLTGQNGVTLLEVLVGFVIFSTSLVAVLDYVSQQLFLQHQSQTKLKNIQLVYDVSTWSEAGLRNSSQLYDQNENRIVTSVVTPVSSIKLHRTQVVLNQYDFQVSNSHDSFEWAVLRVE